MTTKNSHNWLKEKEDTRRKKIYSHIELPVTVILTITALGLSLYFFINAYSTAKAHAESDFGFFGFVSFMFASLFGVFILVGKSINDETNRPSDPQKKPLLCHCGRDQLTVYAIPILRVSWPLWAVGISMGAIIATTVSGNPNNLIFIPALALYALIIFGASTLEYVLTNHSLRCSSVRGITNVGYYLFAYFVTRAGKDAYVERNSRKHADY